MKEDWQQRLDVAFEKYFTMSDILRDDLEVMLTSADVSQSWRRNFIRASAALVEGYAHCFREMCEVGIATGAGPLNSKELRVILEERSFDSADRIKLTLRAAYKSFQLPRVPEFRDEGWRQAQFLIEKRDRLMHPTSVEDLQVPDNLWLDIREGTTWLLGQIFGFMEQLAIVHGKEKR